MKSWIGGPDRNPKDPLFDPDDPMFDEDGLDLDDLDRFGGMLEPRLMDDTMALVMRLGEIEFIDHHVHAPQPPHAKRLSVEEFRRPFTESPHAAARDAHLPSHLTYRWMLTEMGALLGVDPTEEAILHERNHRNPSAYHRFLADNVNLGACYVDDLFAAGQCYDLKEWSRLLGGRPLKRILRIETFVEQGFEQAVTLEEALARLTHEVSQAREHGIVALKSIAGYRSGLRFEAPHDEQRQRASEAYRALREAALNGGSRRIEDKALVDTLVWTALEAAAPLKLPMQFHVGLGDDDIVMTENDPTLMRAIMQHEPFREIPLVLLHCYPYQRQAGYLASIYPNVYVDLGLTIPMVGNGAAQVIFEALELTPVSQLLASTDGHGTPEFQWFGVVVWRLAVEECLQILIQRGTMAMDDAEWFAGAILRDNALRIYPQWDT